MDFSWFVGGIFGVGSVHASFVTLEPDWFSSLASSLADLTFCSTTVAFSSFCKEIEIMVRIYL